MGIVSFLSLFYLLFTVILYIKKKEIGSKYLFFGIMTFLFVILYISVPLFPWKFQRFVIFIDFSVMILLFGTTCGGFLNIIGVNDYISTFISVISSIGIILLLFSNKGIISYIYVPVLVYGVYKVVMLSK